MKSIPVFIRACMALACAASVAACGGGSDDGTVKMSGTITGLTTGGLVISNGAANVSVQANSTSFSFPVEFPSNYPYLVQVAQQPTDLTCTVANGEGFATEDDVSNIKLDCKQTSFNLGGTVTGLRGEGLTIANGSATLKIPAGATTFTFANRVAASQSYGVTVLFQPAGQTCTVASGTGVQPANDNNSVRISCI